MLSLNEKLSEVQLLRLRATFKRKNKNTLLVYPNVSVLSRSNWNLEVLVFEEREKPEYPEKNLSEQGRERTTNFHVACESSCFSSLFEFAAEDVSRWITSATQRQKFHTESGRNPLRIEALIGRRSSYIVLPIVYEYDRQKTEGHEGQM